MQKLYLLLHDFHFLLQDHNTIILVVQLNLQHIFLLLSNPIYFSIKDHDAIAMECLKNLQQVLMQLYLHIYFIMMDHDSNIIMESFLQKKFSLPLFICNYLEHLLILSIIMVYLDLMFFKIKTQQLYIFHHDFIKKDRDSKLDQV